MPQAGLMLSARQRWQDLKIQPWQIKRTKTKQPDCYVVQPVPNTPSPARHHLEETCDQEQGSEKLVNFSDAVFETELE